MYFEASLDQPILEVINEIKIQEPTNKSGKYLKIKLIIIIIFGHALLEEKISLNVGVDKILIQIVFNTQSKTERCNCVNAI